MKPSPNFRSDNVSEPGFSGQITLEMTVTKPVFVKPGDPIAQITFETVEGEIVPYKGRYAGQIGPTPARKAVD